MTSPTTRETADHAELAACPFCGAAAKLSRIISPEGERRGDTPSWDIECNGCWLHGRWSSEVEARAAWNRRDPQAALLSEIAALRGERERLRAAVSKSNDEICQSLGKALGYPWFKDDQANFPGSTESDGVCVGDHVAESIADEAARRLTQAERQHDELRKALEFYAKPIWSIRGEFPEASPHSEYRPDCGDTARQALANQGAE